MSEPQEPQQGEQQSGPAEESGAAPVSPVPIGQEATLASTGRATEVPVPLEREVGRRREQTRTDVTNVLLFILIALLVGGGLAAFVGGEAWKNYDSFLRFALPAVTGLLGTALGFYFGSQR